MPAEAAFAGRKDHDAATADLFLHAATRKLAAEDGGETTEDGREAAEDGGEAAEDHFLPAEDGFQADLCASGVAGWYSRV